MRIKPSDFYHSSEEAVKDEYRGDVWWVWDKYEVFDNHKGGSSVIASANSLQTGYWPLARVPGLFLEFAGLADEGEITKEVWLDWVHRYGVLGLGQHDPDHASSWVVGPSEAVAGGPGESLKNFVREAYRANMVLRLYESAFSPEGPDETWWFQRVDQVYGFSKAVVDGDIEWLRPSHSDPDEARVHALKEVGHQVDNMLMDCYPTSHLCSNGDSLYVQGWGFHSLLGAMYLQMMWLLAASRAEVRWCKMPGCNRIIDFEQPEQPKVSGTRKNDRSMGYRTRIDKEYCSDRCKGLYHYHYRVKPKKR